MENCETISEPDSRFSDFVKFEVRVVVGLSPPNAVSPLQAVPHPPDSCAVPEPREDPGEFS